MNLSFKIAGICMFVLGVQMITPKIATSANNFRYVEQPCGRDTSSNNPAQELLNNSQQEQKNRGVISKKEKDDDAPKSDDGTATRA